MSSIATDRSFPILRIETLLFVLTIILIASLPFLAYTHYLILGFWLLAILLQRSRPVILMLRGFELHSDLKLTNVVLEQLETFGRVVWFTNTHGKHVLMRLKRITRSAGMHWIALTGSAFCVAIVSHLPWSIAILVTLYIGLASLLLLEYTVGNSSHPRLVFFGLSCIFVFSSWGRSLSNQIGTDYGQFSFPPVLLTAYFAVASIRQLIYRGYYNQVTSLDHLLILKKELSKRFLIRTRFVLNSPGLVNEVLVSHELWQSAVTLVLQHTRHVVVDISDLRLDSGLAWEINECVRYKVKILYTCHAERLENAKAALIELTEGAEPQVLVYSDKDFARLLYAVKHFVR